MRKVLLSILIPLFTLGAVSTQSGVTSSSTSFGFEAIKYYTGDTENWEYQIHVVNRYGVTDVTNVYTGEVISDNFVKEVSVGDLSATDELSLFDIVYETNMLHYPMKFTVTLSDFVKDPQSSIGVTSVVSPSVLRQSVNNPISYTKTKEYDTESAFALDNLVNKSSNGNTHTVTLKLDEEKYAGLDHVCEYVSKSNGKYIYREQMLEFKLGVGVKLNEGIPAEASYVGRYTMNVVVEVTTGA